MQELRAILAVYLGTVIGGYSMGLSAVVIPDIVRCSKNCPLLWVDVIISSSTYVKGTAVGASGQYHHLPSCDPSVFRAAVLVW